MADFVVLQRQEVVPVVQKGLRIFPYMPVARLVAAARAAERWGYDAVWVSDEGISRDVYVILTAMAAATSRLRLGTGITNPYTRHVATTAVSIATLNEFSEGRAMLGLGTGSDKALGPLQIRREMPLETLREAIELARALCSGRAVEHNSRRVRLQMAQLRMPPQEIPIWVGAQGPRMLALAVEMADGIWLDSIPKFAMHERLTVIREVAAGIGRSPRVAVTVFVAPDADTLAALRPHFARVLAETPLNQSERLGLDRREVAALRRTLAEDGELAAARLVRDEVLGQFIFTGGPGDCVEEIRALAEQHQITQIVLANHLAQPTFELAGQVLAAV